MLIIGFDQAITAVRRMILLLLSEKTRKSGEVMENPEILSPPLQGETAQGGGGMMQNPETPPKIQRFDMYGVAGT